MIRFARLCYRYVFFCLTGLLIGVSCKEKDVPLGVGDARISGTWRLYQRAFGPDTATVITSIPVRPPQTLTFTGDGRVSSAGDATDYYRNVKYYRVDSTTAGLQLRLIANAQELPGEPQGLRIRRDTLTILPYFSPTLRLLFVRAQ